jgi:hypothetical protein
MHEKLKKHFIGKWSLKEWYYFIDNKKFQSPFGKEVQGSLLYTANGDMSAILQKKERNNFKYPNLIKGSLEEKKHAVETFISYMGKFKIIENTVIHQVQHSLLPNWKNTALIREFKFSENNKILQLTTPPVKTSANKMVTNCLVWEINN